MATRRRAVYTYIPLTGGGVDIIDDTRAPAEWRATGRKKPLPAGELVITFDGREIRALKRQEKDGRFARLVTVGLCQSLYGALLLQSMRTEALEQFEKDGDSMHWYWRRSFRGADRKRLAP